MLREHQVRQLLTQSLRSVYWHSPSEIRRRTRTERGCGRLAAVRQSARQTPSPRERPSSSGKRRHPEESGQQEPSAHPLATGGCWRLGTRSPRRPAQGVGALQAPHSPSAHTGSPSGTPWSASGRRSRRQPLGRKGAPWSSSSHCGCPGCSELSSPVHPNRPAPSWLKLPSHS